MESDSISVELPPAPESVSAARRLVAAQLQRWHLGSSDRLLLLVSEIVTNAVQHARCRLVEVRLVRRPRAVRVEVRDDDSRLPTPQQAPVADADSDAESGRGMGLVGALSDEWGVTAHADGGKTVWFDVVPSADDTG